MTIECCVNQKVMALQKLSCAFCAFCRKAWFKHLKVTARPRYVFHARWNDTTVSFTQLTPVFDAIECQFAVQDEEEQELSRMLEVKSVGGRIRHYGIHS